MKILLLRFSSIGDIVLTTPVIRCIKQQVAGAEVHFLTKKQFEPILTSNPYLDKVWTWEKDPKERITELQNENFDLIIDLHHNLRTAKLKLSLNKKSKSFSKLNIEKYLMVNLKINVLPKVHIVDRYLDVVSFLGVKNDLQGLDYFIDPRDEIDPLSLPATHQNSYISLIIGALKGTKKLPTDKLLELLKHIPLPVVLLGGPAEMEEGEFLAANSGEHVLNYAGKLSLGQSASMLKNAKVVITHDTGLMHIAAAFHKPIISIWGNTIPEFGMYPYLPGEPEKSVIAQVKNLPCRPCSKIGFDTCPKKHFKCMNDQNLKGIADSAERFFNL